MEFFLHGEFDGELTDRELLHGEFFGGVTEFRGEARVRTQSDTNQRHVHVQARGQCPTPEGPEERSRRGTTRPGKSQLSSSFPWVLCKCLWEAPVGLK